MDSGMVSSSECRRKCTRSLAGTNPTLYRESMIFQETPIQGVFVIRPEERCDSRGFFARLFCESEFSAHRLETRFVQANASLSINKGTLRGMHYQLGAAAEVKLVRCTSGALYDVALDLRPDSSTFGQWFGVELTAANHTMLYIPRGCAHGFITLDANTEVFYLVSSPYSPDQERGIRFNDPRFSIQWPLPVEHISQKDAGNPDFDPVYHGMESLRGLL
ncbi:dTDP-4-dehydrorhamnose 3,5-epimerase [Pseudacidobacterium ailaaui]|uniref:dTDP-4-dehydrorhamnose 3,5-epimerase n=1 Tax=Pseudacidobacterium ailaaui TaxID=1382359 RepID=UPI0032DF1B68